MPRVIKLLLYGVLLALAVATVNSTHLDPDTKTLMNGRLLPDADCPGMNGACETEARPYRSSSL